MVGVDTVLADDPLMTDRSGLRRRRPLLRIVLDSALRMPLDCKLVSTAQNDVVIFTVSNDEARIRELEQPRRPRRSASCGCRPRPARESSRQTRRRRHPHPAHRNRHAPQHGLPRRRPRRPPPPLRLAADHGLRRRPRLQRHAAASSTWPKSKSSATATTSASALSFATPGRRAAVIAP